MLTYWQGDSNDIGPKRRTTSLNDILTYTTRLSLAIPSFNTSIVSTTLTGSFNSASTHVRLLLPEFSTDLSPLHQASPLDLPLGYHCHSLYPHKVFPSCYSFAASAYGHRGFIIYRLSPDFLPTSLRVLRLRFRGPTGRSARGFQPDSFGLVEAMCTAQTSHQGTRNDHHR